MDSNATPPPTWPATAGRVQPGSNRSLYYFWRDGSIYLTLTDSNIVYCVWSSRLSEFSRFFEDLVALPLPPPPGTDVSPAEVQKASSASTEVKAASSDEGKAGNSAPSEVLTPVTEKSKALEIAQESQKTGGNGATETTPLQIQATAVQFEVFLECLFTQTGDNIQITRPSEFWQIALEMADFFDCDRVRTLAVEWLTASNTLDPALRLHLAMTYAVKEWVKPAVDLLLRVHLPDIPLPLIKLMGFSAYIILAETQAKIARHRVRCSLAVPEVTHGAYCDEKDTCRMAWEHAWWGETTKHGVAIALIHPENIPARKILAALPTLSTSYHMSAQCLKLTVKALADAPSLLLKEERYAAKAVQELQRF
ncbi:hypothetical protein C8R46DRAFT_1206155 [Mycena filopes]|nr:hypothetical protein C8R46DRAFT_1206155 [Mycena filopes]